MAQVKKSTNALLFESVVYAYLHLLLNVSLQSCVGPSSAGNFCLRPITPIFQCLVMRNGLECSVLRIAKE